ncbi:putative phage repressor [Magnetococcus marinus MC-1]|uniref:Putative phage repressor n=1 Tax=Magnetococcus marinus (strain ATCC BAA-1437 / JCM 17883 / MC-1) TaxID=156889 RepID=A0LD08_MAGMM|nr:helix-turn-helix transcriptional regulator [Magnetococcus marinus]ABK45851.1 putative phage repressor [Magnetococcus marinus MC-1]
MHAALSQRIRQCAQKVGSGDTLARLSGIPRRTIETYLTGQSEPKASRLVAIAQAADVDVGWLACGQASQMESSLPDDEYTLVPRYAVEASAGHGGAIDEEPIVEKLAFKSDWIIGEMGLDSERLALINVHGDSMEPTLRGGDMLLLDLRRVEVRDDAIYVLRLENHLIVKRAQRMLDGTILIRSDNPIYKEQSASPEQARQLCVIGRVVWVGRRI